MNAQIIKVPKVIELTQLSRTTLYDKMNPKSKRYDESFPRPIKLSLASVGWFEQDIIDWLNSKKS
ncbi:helix-turn-helix transcriptional regulator [Acinetobacter johnsonii]|uniref:helix-turn-helix transcriptional regulator n=1 Tax=Acinetobacter johnsonii TaxID=40214 RepID=UPI001F342BE4|nr:AlpA family phage regulatory protein [Acinetobacter johnsonii]UJA01823.1 AlpA family phage regulatory protein [Acinetobacter johnsonii]